MTIQYASDLHLEFAQNKEYIKKNPIRPLGDILILAGDIMPMQLVEQHADFWDYVASHFEATYWLPGNHEYYGNDISERMGSFCIDIRPNVHLVNNHLVVIENTQFIFSTLWSRISVENQWYVQQTMNDFHTIRDQGARLSAARYNQLHSECLAYITQQLENAAAAKTVVATHHIPTLMNYPEQYRGDALNEAFASEQYELIERLQPDYWLYGHHHTNTPDFSIGNTKMLTNQLGYVQYAEHSTFRTGCVLE
jgi:predicted phosphohydrolase